MNSLTFLLLGLIAVVHGVPTLPTIEKSLLLKLQANNSANIVITLASPSTQEILAPFQHKIYTNRAEQLDFVAQTLKDHAQKTQQGIREFIGRERSKLTQAHYFWISNTVIIRQADFQLVQKLLTRNDLSEIREERQIPLNNPNPVDVAPVADEQWNILEIRAEQAWAQGYVGEGAVVATIDTGARVTHEALADNHRAEYGWFDPEGLTSTPNDGNGHGTAVLGVICGSTKGIGVAPGARWISCKGCGTSSCSEFALLSCAQFISCPTDTQGGNANCGMAPQVVSNSWGGGQGDHWFDNMISAWRAVNIVPIFADSGSGPGCGTVGSPGDSLQVVTVGATAMNGEVSSFSGVGSATEPSDVKPNVVAPGSSIYSAFGTSDTAYTTMSGSSLATPHTAGLVAILFGKNPNLTVQQYKNAIEHGAVLLNPPGPDACGGLTGVPNNHWGWGRIDCLNSINLVEL